MLTDKQINELAIAAQALRRLADEVERTAIGSSRVVMYAALANDIRAEAGRIARLQ